MATNPVDLEAPLAGLIPLPMHEMTEEELAEFIQKIREKRETKDDSTQP